MNDLQPEMFFKWIKVTVAVKERMALGYAECGDQTINSLANSMAVRTQQTIILGGGDGKSFSTGVEYLKFGQILSHLRES